MRAGYRQPVEIVDKPVGLEHQVDVAGAFGIEIPEYLPVQPGVGRSALDQVDARHGVGHAVDVCEFCGNRARHFADIQLAFSEDFVVQINVGMIEPRDQFPGYAVSDFDVFDDPLFVQAVGPEISRIDAKFFQPVRHLGRAVIGGENDEGLPEPHLLINKCEQLRQGLVEAQQIVFAFQT